MQMVIPDGSGTTRAKISLPEYINSIPGETESNCPRTPPVVVTMGKKSLGTPMLTK